MPNGSAGLPPLVIEAELRKALQLAAAQRHREAIAVLRNALARDPAHVAARCLLAAMLHETGQAAAALDEIDTSPVEVARHPSVQETRATVLLSLGRAAEAEQAARAALAANPRSARAWLTVALALETQQRLAETIDSTRRLLALQPGHALAGRLLARSLARLGRSDEAVDAALSAVAIAAESADSIVDEFTMISVPATLRLLDRLCAREPASYHWAIRTARLLHQLGRSSEALAASERAHALAPTEPEPLEMRAVTLLDRGETDRGLALYRELPDRGNAAAETANRRLILLHYDPAQDNETLFREHLAWVRDHVRPFGPTFVARGSRDPERPLRVGWVSPRFEGGPVASFFPGLLDAFDRTSFKHTLVSLRQTDPVASKRFRHATDDWISVQDLGDDDLLRLLRDREFDIVVDLAGHSTGNRLRVLAQRVAPLQLCWLDYFDTTAVAAIDGWITDCWLTPPGSTQRFTERVLRLESGRFCYTPPAPVECTRRGDGAPVFVSFNRPARFNDGVLDAWSEILRRAPTTRLELGAALFDDDVACERTLARFAERGIGRARIGLHGQRAYVDLLDAYRRVDIALDPFPFSGCTTTCDALWMGVPVVTRSGETFVARQSASLLQRLGRADWIAGDVAGYIERAVALAADVDSLRAQRAPLRERMLRTLCDAPAQARDFAALLRGQWREHCGQASP